MPYDSLRKCVSRTVVRPGSSDDSKASLARELAQPSVTFHGAPRRVIESIVRYGFVVPGEKVGQAGKELEVRCGSSFGQGIYSSPDAMYASHYLDYQDGTPGSIKQPSDVPGMRLIVCATLMGRTLAVTRGQAWRKTGLLSDQAHSHVSPDGLEYIVFDSSQIIPCYVLHLDYGADRAREEFKQIAADPAAYFQGHRKQRMTNKWDDDFFEGAGEIQRQKQALKAAAAKWFPYGFGPAQGTRFVIEDIAEISDDEETFGDFQLQRVEQESEIRETGLKAGGSWFDEYQTVRSTQKRVKVP